MDLNDRAEYERLSSTRPGARRTIGQRTSRRLIHPLAPRCDSTRHLHPAAHHVWIRRPRTGMRDETLHIGHAAGRAQAGPSVLVGIEPLASCPRRRPRTSSLRSSDPAGLGWVGA